MKNLGYQVQINPVIYAAGKTWHNTLFQMLRDVEQFNINSRWIDLENGSDFVENHKEELWQLCLEDSTQCDIMVIYCHDKDEEQRGVLVEFGQALAAGKPIYIINTCKTFEPNGISDCAFTYSHNVHWIKSNRHIGIKEGFEQAVDHYLGIQPTELVA